MTPQPQHTLAERKELRAPSAVPVGAQRIVCIDIWATARQCPLKRVTVIALGNRTRRPALDVMWFTPVKGVAGQRWCRLPT